MDGTLTLVTAPTLEPLTVDEAKAWARITTTDEDDIVERLISVARGHVEELTGRALNTQTYSYYLDAFPCQIDLPRPRLQSVTYIKYTDESGVVQTLATTEYTVDNKREPARILPAYGKSWPGTQDVPNAVEVKYIAGYGAQPTDVPHQLRNAIAVLVATLYEQRETDTETQMFRAPMAFWHLIDQARIWWL